MKKSVYDAVIIGSGVIGNSVATELSRAGFRTLNIEKLGGAGRGPGFKELSSHGRPV